MDASTELIEHQVKRCTRRPCGYVLRCGLSVAAGCISEFVATSIIGVRLTGYRTFREVIDFGAVDRFTLPSIPKLPRTAFYINLLAARF